MGNVSHLVTRTAALQSSVENGLGEGLPAKDRQFVTALATDPLLNTSIFSNAVST